MNTAPAKWLELAESWRDPGYVKLRFAPVPADRHYLVLSDLREYLERARTDLPIKVLDYGAGPSPYAALFPNAEYRRADYVPSPGLDYVVDGESRVPEADAQFDLVFSTQVAEHVSNPARYFSEAYRLLKPGGRFIVTTHGVWPDHGTPYDFQRWTSAGLARDLAQAGFKDIKSSKLTSGYRAHLFLVLEALVGAGNQRTRLRRLVSRAFQAFLRRARPYLQRRADRMWPHMRVTDLGDNPNGGPPFYLLIAADAVKPNH